MENNNDNNCNNSGNALNKYLSPLGVWALSFGCSVGWGAFVMPGTTFLPIAGPLGTAIGMIAGAIVMLIIGANYHYLMNRFADAGGTFTYAKNSLGHDHGFLSAWFLVLVYIAIIWANATALPLICRNLFGSFFQFGLHYRIAGFDVYLGEVLLSLFVLEIFGAVCLIGGKAASRVQIIMAILLAAGIMTGFVALLISGRALSSPGPLFATGNKPVLGVINIIALAPWAFVGYESISHSAGEFRFSTKKSFKIMTIAVATGTVAYIALALMASSVIPDGYLNWESYINDLGNLQGIKGLPTFFAGETLLGKSGVVILGITALGAIVTGLVGNFIAVSRLLYSMAKEDIIPGRLGRLSKKGTPVYAILFVMIISIPIPFFGRTAIGWIVDVNTIGATIAYAYTSVIAYRTAKENNDRIYKITGFVGSIISLLFAVYFMLPHIWSISGLNTESYFILVLWSIMGFIFFRYVFGRDKKQRFGKSTIVWVSLLFIIFFISLLWVRESAHDKTEEIVSEVMEHHDAEFKEYGIRRTVDQIIETEKYFVGKMDELNNSLTTNSIVQMSLVAIALGIIINVFSITVRREKKMEVEKVKAEQSNAAKRVFLSNMSHDIRTPMNAIIGYTALARKEEGLSPETADYLSNIDASGQQLLALINDILDMNRIESGKMELNNAPVDIVNTMHEAGDMFSAQMSMKQLNFKVSCNNISERVVIADKHCINRVLLNLISNAYKYTPVGGSIELILDQTDNRDGRGSYEIRVKDTGIGMKQEFADRIYEAYSREKTREVENIQGTGLGMAITKSIVDLMGGEINIITAPGKGTEFILKFVFETVADSKAKSDNESGESNRRVMDFSKMRLLLVEDALVNREIANMILSEEGFTIESAENGKEAVDMIRAAAPGYYDLVLMDIQMPVMNGYDATREIRALEDREKAGVPIIAVTANAFSEDVKEALDSGMNAHIAKPYDITKMMITIGDVLEKAKAKKN
ncbi:MAG: amino acid permease [Lachnospiraceae bacterium]|nr:amino acid permease [Lachnospiraceae bacterium]